MPVTLSGVSGKRRSERGGEKNFEKHVSNPNRKTKTKF
jgi:hypothetical protein